MNLKKIVALMLAVLLVAGCFAGCGGNSASSTTATTDASSGTGTSNREDEVTNQANEAAQSTDTDRVLKFGIQKYSSGYMDPASDISSGWNYTRFGVGECLFRFDNAMNVVNTLCDEYTVNVEHTEWVFHIRDGIKFSDGCALTPTKVQESFERILKDGAGSDASPESYLPFESVMTADDASGKLTIVTPKPIADITKDFCYPTMAIIDVEHTSDYKTAPIGTGPYKVTAFNEGVSCIVERNESYWNGNVPYASIELIFMGDASAKAMALEADQIDLAENVTNAADLNRLKEDSRFTVTIASGVRTGIATLNLAEGKFLSNETLRHAVIKALDRNTMCEVTVGGLYTAGFSVLPSILDYGYSDLTEVDPYDPEEAMRILDEAGIVDTDGDGIRELDGKNVVLKLVTYSNRCLDIFGEATLQLLEEVGIGVDLLVTDSAGIKDQERGRDFDLVYTNWTTVGTGDPRQYMYQWVSTSSNNYDFLNDEEYDNLFAAYENTFDNAERKDLVQKMQQRLIDLGAAFPLGYYNSSFISNNASVGGAAINTIDYYWVTTDIYPAA